MLGLLKKRPIRILTCGWKSAEHGTGSPWQIGRDGILRYNGRVYVPSVTAIKSTILQVNHDEPQGGHQGVRRTSDIIHRKYYWQGMTQGIAEYCSTCDICQRTRTMHHIDPMACYNPYRFHRSPWPLFHLTSSLAFHPAVDKARLTTRCSCHGTKLREHSKDNTAGLRQKTRILRTESSVLLSLIKDLLLKMRPYRHR